MEKKFNRIKTPLQQLIFLYIPYKTTLKLIMRNKKFQNKLEIDINQSIIYSIFKEYNIIIDNCKEDNLYYEDFIKFYTKTQNNKLSFKEIIINYFKNDDNKKEQIISYFYSFLINNYPQIQIISNQQNILYFNPDIFISLILNQDLVNILGNQKFYSNYYNIIQLKHIKNLSNLISLNLILKKEELNELINYSQYFNNLNNLMNLKLEGNYIEKEIQNKILEIKSLNNLKELKMIDLFIKIKISKEIYEKIYGLYIKNIIILDNLNDYEFNNLKIFYFNHIFQQYFSK